MLYQISPGKVGVDPQVKPPFPSAVDWTHPLSRGLVGCFLMNESGRLIQNLTNKYTGKVALARWVPLGLYFETTLGYISEATKHPFGFERTNTFSAHICVAAKTNAAGGVLVGNFRDETTLRGWELGTVAGGLQAILSNTITTNWIVATANYTFTLDKPTSVTLTYSGTSAASGVEFYVNGLQLTKNAPTADTLNATIVASNEDALLRIGGRTVGGYSSYYGTIIHCYVFNRALTQPEIQSLYLSPYQFVIEA